MGIPHKKKVRVGLWRGGRGWAAECLLIIIGLKICRPGHGGPGGGKNGTHL